MSEPQNLAPEQQQPPTEQLSTEPPVHPYDLFLDLLVRTRQQQKLSVEEVAQRLQLSPEIVEFYEEGGSPLDVIQLYESRPECPAACGGDEWAQARSDWGRA